jgi:aminoglycoside phosphotransferase family enzyme/predicted kinase
MNPQPNLTLESKIDALSDPALYDGAQVTVHQTHISVVFVANDRAYKLKKPVDFGFVDYSTPELRRELCEAEVELNGRLAPDVYLGVRSVVPRGDGLAYSTPDDAEAVDWVVEMQRLDESDNFLSHLHAGTLEPAWMADLGRKLADFHGSCELGEPGVHGCFDTVAKNARDNFAQSNEQVGHTVHEDVFERARRATNKALEQHAELIARRDATHRCTRDTHGDLRLEHVYRTDGKLAVVDCIEFNDAFRFADPVADIAFLVMDLRIRWGNELADAFTEAYFAARPGGEELLDFYVAYRSAVRAKVHGLAACESELSESARERAFVKSRAHWLFTWGTLAAPGDRPALVLVGGLPGTGKTTVGRILEHSAGFRAIDSDRVRKELAGLPAEADASAAADSGIYTAAFTERTYDACLDKAREAVFAGERVVVSATFRDEAQREAFLREAHALGVPGLFFECDLPRDVVLDRIAARQERGGDASDADAGIYDHVASQWEPLGDFVRGRAHRVPTTTRDASRRRALEILAGYGLVADDVV